MTILRLLKMVVLLSTAFLLAVPAFADRDRGRDRDDIKKWQKEEKRYSREDSRGYKLDSRHHHNRYYPSRGFTIETLPRGYRTIKHRNNDYYYYSGTWYRNQRDRFIVDFPPIGLTLSFLPDFYTTIWVGGLPYYYADGVYYRWMPRERVYVISDPPVETEVIEQPEMPEQLFIYPKEGQNETMQADDRYECHRWSSDQTSFDPTKTGGNVPDRLYDTKKDDYQRAMKACLEARGYSVQ